ncbi:MAG TPA: fumarylacetoacetate hydrolase family protein [Solirubrobacteraceae bacterium]|jgi:2-keto-4-pentenoate hydratase/2-oxohepta-3-ene-1,7-dioic acid hydratase in catechol pathway|nr:fumarylacetoacetate hydrolase family protein [Solirubrobacteraceae bacterium]
MWALGTFRSDQDDPFPGLIVDEQRVIDLSGYGWNGIDQALQSWSSSAPVLDNIARGSGGVSLERLEVLAPLVPTQILQSGANYRKHVLQLVIAEERERGDVSDAEAEAMGAKIMDDRIATGEPYIFLGAASAVTGPYDDVVLPARGEQHDWELELAVVIGIGGRQISMEDAFDHVAGYVIANDLTTRDLVYRPDLKAIGSDWLRAKNAPTFLPLGPWIVPAQSVPDPRDLTITLKLNGEVMQDESAADMIFDVPTLVSYASTLVTLQPGDLILTGSPAGNGMHHRRFLQPGDVIESSITGLGTQRNVCVSEAP